MRSKAAFVFTAGLLAACAVPDRNQELDTIRQTVVGSQCPAPLTEVIQMDETAKRDFVAACRKGKMQSAFQNKIAAAIGNDKTVRNVRQYLSTQGFACGGQTPENPASVNCALVHKAYMGESGPFSAEKPVGVYAWHVKAAEMGGRLLVLVDVTDLDGEAR